MITVDDYHFLHYCILALVLIFLPFVLYLWLCRSVKKAVWLWLIVEEFFIPASPAIFRELWSHDTFLIGWYQIILWCLVFWYSTWGSGHLFCLAYFLLYSVNDRIIFWTLGFIEQLCSKSGDSPLYCKIFSKRVLSIN